MPRNKAIDTLRGLGIIAIILIHVAAWYRFDNVANFIWNWGQFAVPVFVFCSTYLFFVKKLNYEKGGFVKYALKRLNRLLAPFYVYLGFFYLVILIKDPGRISFLNVVQNITLTTPGDELNWAVLLFVYMFFITLFLLTTWKKFKPAFALFALASLASSIVFLNFKWPYHYKLIMWLPWTMMVLFSWYFAKFEAKKYFFGLTILATGLLFTGLYYLQSQTLGVGFWTNKYPPNLYYLSYGMLATSLIYWLAKMNVFKPFEKVINYFSQNSYTIFFIHLWLITTIREFFGIGVLAWWQFGALILSLTVIIQAILTKTTASQR